MIAKKTRTVSRWQSESYSDKKTRSPPTWGEEHDLMEAFWSASNNIWLPVEVLLQNNNLQNCKAQTGDEWGFEEHCKVRPYSLSTKKLKSLHTKFQ